ncbi:StAR related lipid transfer domain containing 5 S homeolog [Xenopus laevis]|uniref:MGC131265 protein n=1 Tax=Xenopus laevis TaxID=8355 RepID=Q3KPW3_XENLA|nr:StAR related lipid transfer domain containing 5 S homeolog [Xenopus laevis]AAI06516.1 MGC131265 protein [Xenopus laevis]
MEHAELARSAADKLLSYTTDESGWKLCKRTREVAVYWRPSAEFTGNLYKGEGIVSAKLEDVWECLKPEPGGLRVKWDNNVDKFHLIDAIADDITVCQTVTPSAAMGIIAPRDFVDVVLIKRYEDGSISSNATNVDHPGCPPQKGFVRGFNHPCGCFCIPVPGEPKKTRVLSFFQTDLSGYLPKSVVESFFPYSMVNFYSNFTKAVKAATV